MIIPYLHDGITVFNALDPLLRDSETDPKMECRPMTILRPPQNVEPLVSENMLHLWPHPQSDHSGFVTDFLMGRLIAEIANHVHTRPN